jgi:hypothetical protein
MVAEDRRSGGQEVDRLGGQEGGRSRGWDRESGKSRGL